MLNCKDVKVGDRVAVARSGSWSTHSEGVYRVVKADRVKLILQRESDQYQRIFSVKKNREMGPDTYRAAFLESIEEMEQRQAALAHRRALTEAWGLVQTAAGNCNIEQLDSATASLKRLLIPARTNV